MQLNTKLVKWFENEQRKHGTKIALYNLLWRHAAQALQDIGVRHIRTDDKAPRLRIP